MIDAKWIREDAETLKAAIARKKFEVDWDALFAADQRRRQLLSEAESARAKQKAANEEMAKLEKGSEAFQTKVQEMKSLSAKAKELDAEAKAADQHWQSLLMSVPNIPDDSVPDGESEGDNVEVASWGDSGKMASAHAVPHYEIPWFESRIDFERGVKATGAGFPFYVGDMARLQRALISFCLEEAGRNGYVEMLPPLMVNANSATATGQLPDKEGQMYVVPNNELYLIPTAEVPVTNFYRDEILEEKQLPVNHCAYTPCFRREAGSWGKHVRGLNRLHQFDKVELVKWVHPEASFEELERLRADAERLLQQLQLPYRTLLMCAGDIGFPHAKQYDIEVWSAGQQRWLEVSSCSNFTDFQARRAGLRYRPAAGGKPIHVHTLNGSGLGLPRVLAAILENNLQENGQVRVPEVLQKWYGNEWLGASG